MSRFQSGTLSKMTVFCSCFAKIGCGMDGPFWRQKIQNGCNFKQWWQYSEDPFPFKWNITVHSPYQEILPRMKWDTYMTSYRLLAVCPWRFRVQINSCTKMRWLSLPRKYNFTSIACTNRCWTNRNKNTPQCHLMWVLYMCGLWVTQFLSGTISGTERVERNARSPFPFREIRIWNGQADPEVPKAGTVAFLGNSPVMLI